MATRRRGSGGARVKRSHWKAPSGREYPIVDAKPGSMLMIQPTKPDVINGIPRDPNNCAIAQACMRMHGTVDCQIGIDKAYVVTRLPGGKEVAMRWKLHKRQADLVNNYDAVKTMPAEAIMLFAPPPSERMESLRAQKKRQRTRWATIGKPTTTRKMKKIHLRNASRRAQVVVT